MGIYGAVTALPAGMLEGNMTGQEFLREIQNYYGPYPSGQQKYIAEYVHAKAPAYLARLFRLLIKNEPSQYKTPPDIAVMNQYDWEARRELQHEERERIAERFALPEPDDTAEYDVRGLIDGLRDKLRLK